MDDPNLSSFTGNNWKFGDVTEQENLLNSSTGRHGQGPSFYFLLTNQEDDIGRSFDKSKGNWSDKRKYNQSNKGIL